MKVFVILLISIAALGCSTSATIYKKDGTSIEATVLSSDFNNIYIDTLAGKEPINKTEITEIDHPGNVTAVIGSAAIGMAGINTYLAVKTEDESRVLNKAFAVVNGVCGLSMLIGGLTSWNRSNDALIPGYKNTKQNLFITPQIYYTHNKPSFGLNFCKQF